MDDGNNNEIFTRSDYDEVKSEDNYLENDTTGGKKQNFKSRGEYHVRDGQVRDGSNWLFLMAIFSITSILFLLVTSSSISRIAYAYSAIKVIGFVVFGYLARKKKPWAFIIGILLCTDNLIGTVIIKNYIGSLVNILAIWQIYKGYKASKLLKSLDTINV